MKTVTSLKPHAVTLLPYTWINVNFLYTLHHVSEYFEG